MWSNLLIGCILIVFSVIVHAYSTRFVMIMVRKKRAKAGVYDSKEFWTSIVVLIMFAASFIEALAWAFTYLFLDAFNGLDESLYFSIVTFTTLGYGDIVLSNSYRLLASLEAANGIIIFGWSTAIIITVVQKYYLDSGVDKDIK